MRLKVIQIREPRTTSPGNVNIKFPETMVVDARTGEPLLGVQVVSLKVDSEGTIMTMTVHDPDVEIRDRLSEDNRSKHS